MPAASLIPMIRTGASCSTAALLRISSTFVLVGTLRTAAIAAASPVLQDAVVCGEDRAYVGLLGFPNVAACRHPRNTLNMQSFAMVCFRAYAEGRD